MWWFTKKNRDVEPTETESAYPVSEIQNEDRVPIPKEKFILESNVADDLLSYPFMEFTSVSKKIGKQKDIRMR